MPQKILELKSIKESTADFEKIEERIKYAFRKLVYGPIMQELAFKGKLLNARDDLYKALMSGRITFSDGEFHGQLDSQISKELRLIGAKWKKGSYKISMMELPIEVRAAISTGLVRQRERVARIDKRLGAIDPAKIAESVKSADIFEITLDKTHKEVGKSLENITVLPELTIKERKKIADEWQSNMDLWISNFTKDEILRLRTDIAKSTASTNRQEALHRSIERSYGVTESKAKFLARQETSLLMAKFKETRYTKAGIKEYKWSCVAGSKLHPVRPSHKILDGKIFSWDNPPITTAPGEPLRRNNPGQDYNCRCSARPIVRFNT